MSENKGLELVRSSYWEGLKSFDKCGLHDSVIDALSIDRSLTDDEEKAVYDLLPMDIVLEAVEWSLNDTEVSKKIYGFVKENETRIRAIIVT